MPTPDDYNNQPGYRNFNAPPGTPGYFTVANPMGGPPLPGRTTESSTRNGNPQATQVAAAPTPPPPGVPVGTTYPPLPGQPPPPAKPGENIADPTPPTPDKAAPPPEPAAKPLPNLGAWTPDQAKPWMHVKPIAPQQVPDRPPDTHVGTRPAYHPRPTEAGYTPPVHQPGQPYSFAEQLGFALQAGFTGQAAYTAAALGMAESGGYTNRVHVQDGGKPFNSYGLMQINGSNDDLLRRNGINGASAAVDPLTSYKAAYIISKGGTDFSPWTTYTHGQYKAFLDPNAQPAASSTLAVGPRQEYRPPQGREPAEWGRTPEHDWTPGSMPTAHDIPGILGALLPIAIAGILGGGGLGMIAAYAGYQNARNKGQQEEAKEQRTRWRDQLAETEAGLKEELLESSGLMAEFGNDFTSPAAQQAWSALAAKYQDPQLRAALESGNPAAVQALFKKRDEAFQTIGKVSAAETKADEQEKTRQEDEKTLKSWGAPGPGPGEGGGETAPPPGPSKPWENLGPGFAGGPPAAAPTPPAPAGVPPGGAPAPPAATPAAAPAPSEQPPAPEEPPPGPEAPAPSAPPGDTTLPDVRVAAPAPTPAAAPAPPPAAARSTWDELVSEGVNGQDIEKFKAGMPKEGLPRLQKAIADQNARIDAVQPGPQAAAQLAAIDKNFADYVTGVSRYTAQLPSPRANTGRDFADRVMSAAKKINPQWNQQNYKKQEDFSDPKGSVQIRLTRASTMGEAAANVMKDAKVLQDAGIEVTQDKISEAIDRIVNNLGGTSPYMAIANDILAFTQEDQALRTGNPSVTETEAQNTLVSGKVLLGSLEQIRTYVQHNIDTANAAITHYQGQWKQMQGYGDMPGTDPEADAIISSMKYLDPTSGQYHAPKGFELPAVLRAAIPEHAPPPTILPKPGTQSALPSDLPPPTGHAEGSTAKDASGKVVAIIRNGQWVAP